MIADITFTVSPNRSTQDFKVTYSDLKTTKEIWDGLTTGQKEYILTDYAMQKSYLDWELDYFNDKLTTPTP